MEEIKQIASRFALDGEIIEISPLKVGHINDSFVVATDKDKYLLQRINTSIFKDVDLLQSNIKKVTDHIRARLQANGEQDIDRKVMRMVPAIGTGKLYVVDENGEAWRAYNFIADSHSSDEITPRTAYLAGKAFGNFQNMLADLPIEAMQETIPNFHNLAFRIDEFHQALASDKANRQYLPESQAIIRELESRADRMLIAHELMQKGKLPKRINHCDAKVNNMLLDHDDNPIAIVDLDTVMPSLIFSDFGDFMRTAANTGAEDDNDLDNVGVNFPVMEAFAKGYMQEAKFLTPIETTLMPYGVLMMTYMQTLRFFTDYLNGDTYYKIDYPEHNLQRTRAQLRLLHEQEDNFYRIWDIIHDQANANPKDK